MSASLKPMDWCSDRVLPNDDRSDVNRIVESRHARARPAPIAAKGMRAHVSISRARCIPVPSSPRRASAGNRTESKKIGWVSDARHPILSYAGATVTPGESSGTKNADVGRARLVPSDSPVAANTTAYLDCGVPELVMNCFAPLSTQSVPSRRATVSRSAASLPPDGSVSAKQENTSPEAMRGVSSRCSSGLLSSIVAVRTPLTTPTWAVTAIDESQYASSSTAMQSVRRSAAEPYGSGSSKPNTPSCASSAVSPTSKVASLLRCAAPGATRSRQKSRMVARHSRWLSSYAQGRSATSAPGMYVAAAVRAADGWAFLPGWVVMSAPVEVRLALLDKGAYTLVHVMGLLVQRRVEEFQ